MSRHFSRLLPNAGVLAVLACSATAAYASPIVIQSGNPGADQSQTCANVMNSSTTCVAITPHPAWQPNDPNFAPGAPGFTDLTPSGAVWVSFADTGYTPDSTTVPQDLSTPSMTYTYTFMAPPNAQFIGRVWSDDSANIYLDGLFVGGGSDTTGGGTTYGAGYTINAFLGAGSGGGGGGGDGLTTHTITIPVEQAGDGTTNTTNPFGVMVEGEVSPSTVPEPATLALFGIGLVGAGIIRRKRKSASA